MFGKIHSTDKDKKQAQNEAYALLYADDGVYIVWVFHLEEKSSMPVAKVNRKQPNISWFVVG